MAERLTHSGGCHCGAVRFEVDAVVDEVLERIWEQERNNEAEANALEEA